MYKLSEDKKKVTAGIYGAVSDAKFVLLYAKFYKRYFTKRGFGSPKKNGFLVEMFAIAKIILINSS